MSRPAAFVYGSNSVDAIVVPSGDRAGVFQPMVLRNLDRDLP